MLLSIIMVSYNTAALTLAALESVVSEIESSLPLKGHCDIWFVDNNSSDSTLEQVQAVIKKTRIPITVIQNPDNHGFASANNQAITASQGKYVLLLNSDTIVKTGAIEHLISTFESQPSSETTSVLSSHLNQLDHLGILAPQLVNPDGSFQAQGGSFPTLLSLTAHMMFLDDLPEIGKFLPSTQHTGKNARSHSNHNQLLEPKEWVAGTAMMIKRVVFDEIGLLDDQIFMYGEDMEFCLRAVNHHWDCAIDLKATIIHYGSASSSNQNAIIGEIKGYRYIWAKHKPLWQIPLSRVILWTGCVLRIMLFSTFANDGKKVAAYQAALGYV